MANAVQKYVNSKQCCFSNSIHTSDKRIKYGLEEVKCQIIKDSIANIYMEMLSCDSVASDIQWYKGEIIFEWIQDLNTPIALPGNFIITGNPNITSYDGTRSLDISMSGTYYANNMLEVNQILTKMWENTNTSDFLIYVNTDPVTGVSKVIYEYTESWGNLENGFVTDLFGENGFSANFTIVSHNKLNSNNKNCITFSQMCGIKEWLDKYCKTCDKNITTPKSIN